jgi:hypothetical protein
MKRRKPQLIDKEATALAKFKDPRSYCKRNRIGDTLTFRFGEDMADLRRKVFMRSRGFCEMPMNGYQTGIRCQRNIGWETFELDHNPSLAQGGDDSEEGTRAICRRCHIAKHNRSVRSDRADRRANGTA